MILSDLLDVKNLQRHLDEGLICRREDYRAERGYVLYNYTDRAQFSRTWDRETMTCRGLVVAPDGTIVSRPFPKFFNLAEHESPAVPDVPVGERFTVHEKVDGSLIIASSPEPGALCVTTRGAFASLQAVAGKRLLLARRPEILYPPPGVTWLLELVAPWNRIVVDYGEEERLVFLAAIDNETGEDVEDHGWEGPVATVYDGLEDVDAVAARMLELGPDQEGFVLRFESGFRVKAKGSEYVRLHRLLTGLNERRIHEVLARGGDIDDVLGVVPDEFYGWVDGVVGSLMRRFRDVETEARAVFHGVKRMETRKEQAIAIKDFEHRAVVFAMLDGKDYEPLIWKRLVPEPHSPTFATDADA